MMIEPAAQWIRPLTNALAQLVGTPSTSPRSRPILIPGEIFEFTVLAKVIGLQAWTVRSEGRQYTLEAASALRTGRQYTAVLNSINGDTNRPTEAEKFIKLSVPGIPIQQAEQEEPMRLTVKELSIRLLEKPPAAPPEQIDAFMQATVAKHLRTLLPSTPDSDILLTKLERYVNHHAMPRDVQLILNRLQQSQLSVRELGSDTSLRKAVNQSGIFLENKLNTLKTGPAPQLENVTLKNDTPKNDTLKNDRKALLLQLQSRILSTRQHGVAELDPAIRKFVDKPTISALPFLVKIYVSEEIAPSTFANTLAKLLGDKDLKTLQTELTNRIFLNPPAVGYKTIVGKIMDALVQQPEPDDRIHVLLKAIQQHMLLTSLQKDVDTTLAQIVKQQLLPLSRESDSGLLLYVSIPINDDNAENRMLKMEFTEQPDTTNNNNRWTVNLEFDLSGLGKVKSTVSYTADDLSVLFKSANENVIDKFANMLPVLENNLTRAGFNATFLKAVVDKHTQHSPEMSLNTLVDEKA